MAHKTLPCDELPLLDPPIDLPKGKQPIFGPAVAVIVFHGMGQQVKFQTLNDVAYGIRDAVVRAGQTLARPHTVLLRQHAPNDDCKYIPRAELEIDGIVPTQIHIYECYWAPLTEGKATLRDVAKFLIKAGVDGFRLGARRFQRIVFGNWKSLSIERTTRWQFAVALGFVLSLIGLNMVLGLVTSVGVLRGADSGWPGQALVHWLSVDFAVFEVAAFLFAASAYLAYRRWDRFRQSHARTRATQWTLRGKTLYLALAWGFVLATIACGFAALVLLLRFRVSDEAPTPLGLSFFAVIAIASAVSWVVRSFLVQYAGDVVVYVSAHSVSQFDELRTTIQKTALNVANAVYAQGIYQHVILLGHSLGSVIAYDTFNALTNEGSHHELLRRTDLITFGSPLDKTAFVFRSQKVAHADFREALATQIQAALVSSDNRPASWTNVFSKDDWISGKLNFYGQAQLRNGESDLQNREDTEACIPIVAHVQYWRNNLVFDTVVEKIQAVRADMMRV